MYLSFRNFGTPKYPESRNHARHYIPFLRDILTYEFSDHARNGVNQAGQNVFA